MQHRFLRRAIAGLCLVLGPFVARPTSAGDTPRTENPLVNRGLDVIEAVAAKDDVGLDELAEDPRFDPYDVANTIFVRAIFPKTKPELAARLSAAARWAGAVARFPRGAGLSALVAKWQAYGPDDLDRERRLVIVPIQMAKAAQQGDLDEVAALATKAEADIVAAPASLSAWGILVGYAGALEAAGRFADAAPLFARSAERAEALGSFSRAAGGWDHAAKDGFRAGRWAECREHGERAIAAFARAGLEEPIANQRNNIAAAFLREGRLADARVAAERALVEVRSTRAPAVRPRILVNLASILALSGESDAGGRAFSEGIELMTAQGAERGELLRVRFAYAQSLLEADAWAAALVAFESLATELSPDDSVTVRLLVPRSMAILLRALGRDQDALAHARLAHEVAVELHDDDPSTLAATKSELALALALLGRHEEAVAIFRPAGEAKPSLTVESAAGGSARDAWRKTSVDDAVTAAHRAIEGYEAAGIPQFAVDVRRNLARILLDAGRPDEALTELSKIRSTGDASARSRTAFLTAIASAEVAIAAGRSRAAAHESLRALELHRVLARGLAAEDALGTRADAAKVADLGLGAAARWSDDEPAARSDAATVAFQLAESSRGLLLAEGLKNRTAVLWSALSPELVVADRESRHERRGGAGPHDGTFARVGVRRPRIRRSWHRRRRCRGAFLRSGLAAARRHREDVLTRIGREARRVTSFLDPAPPALASLRELLRPNDAFVEFQDAGDSIFAVVVRKDEIAVRRLGGGTDVRDGIVAWLRLVSTPGSTDDRAAAKVYDAVWRPLEAELAGARRVTITADGALAYVPFDALIRVEGSKSRRLIETLEISYVPSAGVWIALAAERTPTAGDRILAVGDPDLGALSGAYAPLPGGADEARELAARVDVARRSLFIGGDAGVDLVLGALAADGRRFRVAHFACHGTSDPTRVRGAGLILAGGALLDSDRLARARVPADLVTLSACESARGLEARGEGVFGLARSFLLAGASRVVTSGWLVSDRDGKRLMGDFYDAHLSRGLAASASLRDAKLLAIHRGGESAHPARWATFTLWGLPD